MTLVIQAHLECDLLHTQETRLQQVLGALHAQQSQITDRRHAHIGLEDVTESPDRKVYGLREVGRDSSPRTSSRIIWMIFSTLLSKPTPWGDVYTADY